MHFLSYLQIHSYLFRIFLCSSSCGKGWLTLTVLMRESQIVDLQVFASPRITLKPLVPTLPCFAKIVVSLMEKVFVIWCLFCFFSLSNKSGGLATYCLHL